MTMATLFGDLESPDFLLKTTASSASPLRINAHIHLPPNFSAFDTTEQAVQLAKVQGIDVLGVSNYYDYAVYEPFAKLARQNNIFPVFGIEIITLDESLKAAGALINDPGNPGKFYICGKAITRFAPLSSEALPLLNQIRERDSKRMAMVSERLADVFADAGFTTGLTAQAIKERIVARQGAPIDTVFLQERHVAQAFQEVVFERIPESQRGAMLTKAFGGTPKSAPDNANAVQNEIRSSLLKAGKPAYIPETFVDRAHAFQLIHALGGIPCYPTLADGTTPICAFETPVEELVTRLKKYGFPCAEFIPLRNTPEVLAEYVRTLRAAGIVITAGTEHNTRDLPPILPTCLNGIPIPDETQAIFEEGACVLAAHQYLSARGGTGFVDAQGKLHPDFSTDDARIDYFAKLGKAVIAAYRKNNP